MKAIPLAHVTIGLATCPAPNALLRSASSKYSKPSCNALRADWWEENARLALWTLSSRAFNELMTYSTKLRNLRESSMSVTHSTIDFFARHLCLLPDHLLWLCTLLQLKSGDKMDWRRLYPRALISVWTALFLRALRSSDAA